MDAVHKKRTKKRRRTVISRDEIEKLEDSFEKEQKPDRITKHELAKQLSKPESFVNIWFQNRRAKERKMKNIPACESKNGIRDHGDKYNTVNICISYRSSSIVTIIKELIGNERRYGWASAELPRNRVNVNLFLRHIRDLSR